MPTRTSTGFANSPPSPDGSGAFSRPGVRGCGADRVPTVGLERGMELADRHPTRNSALASESAEQTARVLDSLAERHRDVVLLACLVA